jgi:hypothetical protein
LPRQQNKNLPKHKMTIFSDPSYSLVILTEKYAVTSFFCLEDGKVEVFILTTDLKPVEGSNSLVITHDKLQFVTLIESEDNRPQLILIEKG